MFQLCCSFQQVLCSAYWDGAQVVYVPVALLYTALKQSLQHGVVDSHWSVFIQVDKDCLLCSIVW